MIKGNPLPRIAVVGVSSLVGAAVLAELRARNFPHDLLHLVDEERHIGRPVTVEDSPAGRDARGDGDNDGRDDAPDDGGNDGSGGRRTGKSPPRVIPIAAFDFAGADLVFFCGRAALAEQYAEAAAAHAWVIDCSAAFRGRSDVPLVVADVNGGAAARGGSHGLIALPGSASVALATALAPLHAAAVLLRAEVATYHAVSGGGRGAMDELAGETVAMLSGKKARGRAFGRQIAFNVIPQVDTLDDAGVTREERRLWEETRRVLEAPALAINATAVRVPVFFGHSLSVHASFERPFAVPEAAAALRAAAGIALIETDSSAAFPTPATVATSPDKVYVGRLRADPTCDRGLNFWVVADNVRKCAAHNAVSVAEILVNSVA